MQGIFRKENTDKALKYGIYRHLPTYEKIIRNLVSFYCKQYKNCVCEQILLMETEESALFFAGQRQIWQKEWKIQARLQ